MREVYFDPKRVGSYSGVGALRRVTLVPRKIVAEWLLEHDALHKPARRHSKRRRVIVGGMRQQWQADQLGEVEKRQRRYDVFSKVTW